MNEPAAVLPGDRGLGRVLRGRRLLGAVALAWSMTVLGMAWSALHAGLGVINLIGLLLLLVSPLVWLLPLWMLPMTPSPAAFAAPLLLFLVPVVLVISAHHATEALSQAYANRALGLPLYEHWMARLDDGLRIDVGGGLLAALLEILGLYCWTRRMPAQRWSIGLLLALFGPAAAGTLYLLTN